MPLRPLSPEEIEGLDLGEPAPAEDPAIRVTPIAGTEKSKDPATGEDRKIAFFASRMASALEELNALENSGFDPTNIPDRVLVPGTPLPDVARNYLTSPKYQQYDRAMLQFADMILRFTTGAQQSDEEIRNTANIYAPKPGDAPETVAAKRRARELALQDLINAAGKAYERFKVTDSEAPGQPPVTLTREEALKELRRRAQNDPDLAAELRRRGMMQ
jgi:hypothetical protein